MTQPRPAPAPALAARVGRVLTVTEVAALLRVSKMTVYRLLHAEELRGYRVGRSFRVPERAVQDYLAHANTVEFERPGGAA